MQSLENIRKRYFASDKAGKSAILSEFCRRMLGQFVSKINCTQFSEYYQKAPINGNNKTPLGLGVIPRFCVTNGRDIVI